MPKGRAHVSIARNAVPNNQAERLQAELIRLWLHSQSSLITTAIFNLVIAWALRNSIGHTTLLVWAAATTGWSAIRYLLWRIFKSKQRSDAETRCWGRLFLALLVGTSLLTAFMAFQVFVPRDTEHQMFIVMWVAVLPPGPPQPMAPIRGRSPRSSVSH